MKLPQQTSTIKCEQISWSITLLFGVTLSGKVSSGAHFFPWNTLPETLQNKKEPIESMKEKIRRYSTGTFVNEF